MGTRLVDWMFGCWHANYCFPRTIRRGERGPAAAAITGTYVVCLDCGKEFAYDWQQMRVLYGGASEVFHDEAIVHEYPVRVIAPLR